MAGYKNNKIMLPIKEFLIVKGQATYELNTIDMTKVTVFYRKYNQEAFLETYSEMPKGDYRINEVGGNKQLEITNLDILDKYYSIQLCRVVDLTSSPYNPSGQVDPITINQHLNEVIADVTFLFTYLKDVGMVMDSSGGNKILAELKPYTTWYMDENGNMAAMPVDSLFEKFYKLVEELRKEVLKLLEEDLEVAERELLEEIKRQLDEYVETTLKQRLDDYATTLEERLQAMIDQAVADKGLMPEGSDWFEIELGNWLVTDLFNKNYTNYPPQINSTDNAGVVKKDITDGGKSQIIRYYTTTGKMFFAVKVNEVWSEWQELGEQTDTMQFTQANHGFVFTAVTLDGATRQWTKANKYTGADGIAVKVDNDRFDVVTRGIVNIPTQARDDKGEVFVYDEYYFLSQEVDGGLSRTKNEIGTFQYLAHISEIDGKQVAYIDIGDSYDLDYDVVDTETADRVGIGTYKTTMRTADTIDDLKKLNLKEGDVIEVLGYYTKGDGADHKRKIESSDDGSGVLLSNGLYANIVHNGEVNVSWFGAKGDGVSDDTQSIQKAIDFCAKNKYYDFTTKEIPCIKFPSKVFAITSLKLKSRIKLVGNGQNSTYLVRYGTADTDEYMLDATGYRTSGNDHEHFLDSIGIHKMTIKGNSNLSTWDLGTNNLFSNGVKFECGTNFVMDQITLSKFKTALRITELYDSSFNILTILASGNDTNAGIMFGRPTNEEQVGPDGNNAIRFDNFRFEKVTLESIVKNPIFQRENRFTNGKVENCTLKFSGNSSTSFNSVNFTFSKLIFNSKPSETVLSESFGFNLVDCVFYYSKSFEGIGIDIRKDNSISTPKFIGCTFKSMPSNCFVCENENLMISNSLFYDCNSPVITSGNKTVINSVQILSGTRGEYDLDLGENSLVTQVISYDNLKLNPSNSNVVITYSSFDTLTKEQLSKGVQTHLQKISYNTSETERTVGTIETIFNGNTYITNLDGVVKTVQTVSQE